VISDLWHYWGGDLASSNAGDLQQVTGTERGQQRVLRRLLTNPGEYIWHPEYGGGLPGKIGSTFDADALIAIIRSQLALEPDVVAQTPVPQVSVTPLAADTTGFSVQISYTDAASNTPVVLSFNLTK